MRRNRVNIELNNIPISELCLLKSQCIRKRDYGITKFEFFKGALLYEIHDSEITEIEERYSSLYENCISENKSISIIYEMMVGITNSKIIYPGLDSCIGITIILKDKTKMGIHFTPMINDNSPHSNRYCDNIKKLCSFFSSNYDENAMNSNIIKVIFSCKENINCIKDHIKEVLKFETVKDCFDKNNNILTEIFKVANLNLDITTGDVSKIDNTIPYIHTNIGNLYPDIDAININIIDSNE